MTRRIVIIQGHPDPTDHHLLHAMADAYAEAASTAGHEVRRIEVGRLEFPFLRTQVEFETGALPPALRQAREDMRWSEHWVFLFPLWPWNHASAAQGLFSNTFSGLALPWSIKSKVSRSDFSPVVRLGSSLPWGCRCCFIAGILEPMGCALSSVAC